MAFTARDQRAVVAVATQFFINGTVYASFLPRLPEIRDRIDVSLDVLGALLTTGGAAGLVGSAATAGIIGRLGSRRALVLGGIGMIAALPLMGFATSPWIFVASLAVIGVFDVIVDVAMNVQGSWLSARRHAPIMNRLHGVWSLGTVVGSLASARLAAAGVSLQTHLVGVAVVLLAALVFVATNLLAEDEADIEPEPGVDTDRARAGARAMLIALGFAGALAITLEIVPGDWSAFRLRDDLGTSAGFAGLGFVAFTVGMTTGRFGGDSLQMRLGDNRLLRVAVTLATIGLAVAALAPNRWLVLAGYALGGLGVSIFFPRLYDLAAKLPGRSGAGIAALTAGSRVAVLGVPLLVGALADTSLSVGTATALVVIPCGIGFGVLALARLTETRP